MSLEAVWNELETQRPQGGDLRARRVTDSDVVFLAIDSANQRHVLVVVTPGTDGITENRIRGLSVTTRDLTFTGGMTQRYIDICCRDGSGLPALDILAENLAAALDDASDRPQAVNRILNRWRHFWGTTASTALTKDAIVGLFAELWFLTFWLEPSVGADEATRRWRGPHGSRHDFEWERVSVEAKGTTSTRGRIIQVHGVSQLDSPEVGRLFLFCLRLREERGASLSLASLVDSTRKRCKNAIAADRLEEGLGLVGYSSVHDPEYESIRFRIIDEALFSVEAAFPRISSSMFRNGIPDGIQHIEYEINLSGFAHLIVAQSPAQLQI